MKEKIKSWLPWINVILIVVIFVATCMVLINFRGSLFNRWGHALSLIGAVPSAELLGFEVNQAIMHFGGGESSFNKFVNSFLISSSWFILLMVIAPFLLVKGYNRMNKGGQNHGITWYAGAFLMILAVSTTMVAAVTGTTSGITVKQSAAASRDSDLLRTSLMGLAFDAAGVMVLPPEFGGGDGSFINFSPDGEDTRSITLEDLKSYSKSSNYRYVIHDEVSDSSITIIGVSDYDGSNHEFINADGRQGKSQQAVKVTPLEQEVFKMVRRGELTN